jgi:serine acetyltransferase
LEQVLARVMAQALVQALAQVLVDQDSLAQHVVEELHLSSGRIFGLLTRLQHQMSVGTPVLHRVHHRRRMRLRRLLLMGWPWIFGLVVHHQLRMKTGLVLHLHHHLLLRVITR